jgi:hypothetical protein
MYGWMEVSIHVLINCFSQRLFCILSETKLAWAVTLLTYIWEVLGSNLGRDTK